MCSQLRKPLAALEEQHKAWLAVARLCTDDEEIWALELLRYNVDYVPSFVLLNPQGEALAKTIRPRSPQHLLDSLHLLVQRAHQAAGRPA
ncbi:hypothetical protein WJX81_006982 [Elliptochloris bilobata]|uniref:Thioredoxin-like protein n=1 Tax=Elliptochloris bilobata TaxID=381761 RepID=A0AAW1S703_9CHLO